MTMYFIGQKTAQPYACIFYPQVAVSKCRFGRTKKSCTNPSKFVTAENCGSVPFTISYLLKNIGVSEAVEFATSLIGEKGVNLISKFLSIDGGETVQVTEKFTQNVCAGFVKNFSVIAIAQATTPTTTAPNPSYVCNATTSYDINIPATPSSPPTLPPKSPTPKPSPVPTSTPTTALPAPTPCSVIVSHMSPFCVSIFVGLRAYHFVLIFFCFGVGPSKRLHSWQFENRMQLYRPQQCHHPIQLCQFASDVHLPY